MKRYLVGIGKGNEGGDLKVKS
jgi:transposase